MSIKEAGSKTSLNNKNENENAVQLRKNNIGS